MLRRARGAAAARIAAALVAATLSGAPRVLALQAPAERHRCSCKAHGGDRHECECATCRKAALAAQASDPDAPPCHRAAARKALQAEPSRPRGAPCVEGTCGAGGRLAVIVAGVEPFTVPGQPQGIVTGERAARPSPGPAVLDRSLAPETPPPRPA